MMETFGKDLAAAQKEELRALISFHNLVAAKQAEIDAMTKQKDAKSAELAKATQDDAQAKQDLEDTKEQLSADQKFLIELKKNCKIADEEYAARSKIRGDELVALSEVLKILTDDSARDLFGKTMSFLQVRSVISNQASLKAQNRARAQAVQRILAAAKKSHNWQLATLAVSAQLDAFTKVKEAMDKMLAELKEQQKEEAEKADTCKKNLDTTEDKIWTGKNHKEDLAETHKDQSN